MKKKDVLKKSARIASTVLGGVMTLSISAYGVVNAQRATIDNALGTSSWKIETAKGDDSNLYNFEAKKGKVTNIDGKEVNVDCSNLKGLFEYEKDVSMRLAAEGTVLLKNDKASLPLNTAEKKNVTLLGSRSYTVMGEEIVWGMKRVSATGTRYGGNMGSVAPVELAVDIATALTNRGFKVNQAVKDAYETYLNEKTNQLDPVFSANYQLNESTPTEVGIADLKDTFGDTAIVTVGRPWKESGYYLPGQAGKADPSEFDENTDVLGLSKDEIATLEFAKANFKNVVVLINSTVMDIPDLDKYADSILWVGLPGVYGFEGISRVLDGTLSPSGKLADTFAARSANSIAMVNQEYEFKSGNGIEVSSAQGNLYYEPEVEGIYTGYKYYESRYYDTVVNARNARDGIGATNASTWNYNNEVVYSFGYGLSYTDFAETINSVEVDMAAQKITAKVTVENTGKTYSGKHAVELYVQAPYGEGSVEKSAIQLVGYEKTKTLKPGEKETVTITADFQDFASWNESFVHHGGLKGAYVLDEGDYFFALGNGANDAVNNVLAIQGYTVDKADGYMTANGNVALAKKITISEVDITTSKAGVVLQNQLESFDLAKQIAGVENFSRQDWKANWPKVYDNLTVVASMAEGMSNHLYTLNANGDPSSVKFGVDNGLKYTDLKPAKGERIAFDDIRLQKFVEQYDLGPALVSLMNGDSWSAGATTVAGVEKAMPLIYLDDGPMGFDSTPVSKGVTRLTADSIFNAQNDPDYETYKDVATRTLPTGVVIGATWNKELTEEAGVMMGQIALWNGATGIQGPGSNTHRNAYNSRNHEYYSEDGLHSGILVDAYCKGAWDQGLICTLKHFAFNDTEMNRMGVSAYMSEQRARENELRAFQMGIENGNVPGLMTGMNRVGSYFVGAHPGLMMGIVRGEWAFNGLIETDMTKGNYDNGRDFIAMGGDSMLESITASKDMEARNELIASWTGDSQYATGEASDAVKSDAHFLQCIQNSLKHITWVYLNSNIMNGVNGSSHLVRVFTWYDTALISVISATGVLFLASTAAAIVLGAKKDEE